MLVAYAFAKSWTESLVTVAHEGSHIGDADGPRTQAATAFALVWLLLIGGVAQAIGHRGGSDGQKMASSTWIPSFVWWAAWSAIALLCRWSGGRLLLHHP